ncbi:hypothetical protein [Pseudomonas sp. PA15(2017)]|nr:hypothetical protein [Pseudomonas sp. PA15(2017)]
MPAIFFARMARSHILDRSPVECSDTRESSLGIALLDPGYG